MRPLTCLLVFLLCLAMGCRSMSVAVRYAPDLSPHDWSRHPLTAFPNPLDAALGEIGLTPGALRFDPAVFGALGGNRFPAPLLSFYGSKPLEIPYSLSCVAASAREKPDSLNETLMRMFPKVGVNLRRGMFGTNPLEQIEKETEKSESSLVQAVAAIFSVRDGNLSDEDATRLVENAAGVPSDAQNAAALVILASLRAAEWHKRAFERCPEVQTPGFCRDAARAVRSQFVSPPAGLERVAGEMDFEALYAGAQDLALAVDAVRERLTAHPTTATFHFEWPTPLGRVILRAGDSGGKIAADASGRASSQGKPNPEETAPAGAGTSGEREEEPILLLMDLDGSGDVHRSGGANASFGQPVSVLIDLGGDDRYEGSPEGENQFGSGVFGYGIVVDLGGDDTSVGGFLSQGSGLFGVGALLDYGGEDSYDMNAHGQGAGSFGLGLLMDAGGSDFHSAFAMAQGFGFTKGCGYLLDRGEGDDLYELRNDKVLYPSAQAPATHNSSVGQGAGVGRRADLSDGHSWAGGFGLLLDEGGNDTYEAGVLAQGAAYWYGMGFLLDLAGDDYYSAHHYCQGAGAHFGVSALIDRAGEDYYRCASAVGQGAAHDGSVAWLVDQAGDDVYEAGVLSLGAANMNSIGLFLDVSGDDRYQAKRPITPAREPDAVSAGGAARLEARGTPREALLNVGVFLDCGGWDLYDGVRAPGGVPGGNNRRWRNPARVRHPGLPGELGVGVDAETGGASPIRLLPYP